MIQEHKFLLYLKAWAKLWDYLLENWKLLDIEGSAGSDVPYLGYTELRLDIPEIAKFDHDLLMMVYPDSKYSHRVPVIIGTLHIDEALDLATYDELASLSRG